MRTWISRVARTTGDGMEFRFRRAMVTLLPGQHRFQPAAVDIDGYEAALIGAQLSEWKSLG